MRSIFCKKCGYVICICEIVEKHREDCRFRIAASLSVELACEHGFQACPICDKCTCGAGQEEGLR